MSANYFLGESVAEAPDRELWLRALEVDGDEELEESQVFFEYGYYMDDRLERGALRCNGVVSLLVDSFEDINEPGAIAASVAVGEIGHAVAATDIVALGAWPSEIYVFGINELEDEMSRRAAPRED